MRSAFFSCKHLRTSLHFPLCIRWKLSVPETDRLTHGEGSMVKRAGLNDLTLLYNMCVCVCDGIHSLCGI